MNYVKGIDVSAWQGSIDWEKARADGVQFAMLRAGYGAGSLDSQFARNIRECNRLGIPCGVYWFSYAASAAEARREAETCLEAIAPYRVEYPVAYDFEYVSVDSAAARGVKINKTNASAFARAFLKTVAAAGYAAVNYTSPDFMARYYDARLPEEYPVWLAKWSRSPDLSAPPEGVVLWQYGSTGRVAGIDGDVDMDACYGRYGPEEAPSDYAAAACAKAVEKGVFRGDGQGRYDWHEAVTRQDLCVVLDRLGLL